MKALWSRITGLCPRKGVRETTRVLETVLSGLAWKGA
jgi:hypothetical protein